MPSRRRQLLAALQHYLMNDFFRASSIQQNTIAVPCRGRCATVRTRTNKSRDTRDVNRDDAIEQTWPLLWNRLMREIFTRVSRLQIELVGVVAFRRGSREQR